MTIWAAYLIPDKNVIRLYSRHNDLTQVKNPNGNNKRTIECELKKLHRDDIFDVATKALEEAGFSTIDKWQRDREPSFDIWRARAVETASASEDAPIIVEDEPIV